MKKNQNGVTLIALAVTIIVMLILAGATMSMLSGDSGLITNARKASASNKEADVKEKMASAYNVVKTTVESERALTGSYDAEGELTKTNPQVNYIELIQDELGAASVVTTSTTKTEKESKNTSAKGKYYVYVVQTADTSADSEDNKTTAIYIDYYDDTFTVDIKTSDTTKYPNKKNQYPMLRGIINFDTNYITYQAPVTHIVAND